MNSRPLTRLNTIPIVRAAAIDGSNTCCPMASMTLTSSSADDMDDDDNGDDDDDDYDGAADGDTSSDDLSLPLEELHVVIRATTIIDNG